MSETKKIFTLAALSQSLERHFRNEFALKDFWVVAEITKVQEKNGHHYLELADSKDGKRVAEMNATMWFSAYTNVNRELKGELNRIFKPGNKVLVLIRIEFHAVFGLKLNILNVDPSITYGEIEKRKRETIERLKDEAVFTLQKEKRTEAVIKKIALIGSPNTSGYRDFLSELLQNNVFNNFKVKEFAATVQGDRAVKSVTSAIKKAEQYNVDLIVLVRGGGSKMDLNVFNEYEIAKAIAVCRLPVITGLGHETDETVSDLVAFHAAITPTAAAKFLYLKAGVFLNDVVTAFDTIVKKSAYMLSVEKQEFTRTSKYLVHFTQALLNLNNDRIRNVLHAIRHGAAEWAETERGKLNLNFERVTGHAKNQIALKKSTELTARLEKIELLSKNMIEHSRVKVNNTADLLDLLSPEALLNKGYTISTVNNKDLDQVKGELVGKQLKSLSAKYVVTSRIEEVKKIDIQKKK